MARLNNLAMQEIMEKINEETLTVFEKDRYKEYLKTVSTCPTYSTNNQLRIHSQNKDATMVCGYDEWKKKGRHVMKGEKGIKIITPMFKNVYAVKKDANGNTVYDASGNPVKERQKEFIGYKDAYVFDITQTAGKPIPSVSALLHGKVDGFSEIMEILKEVSPAPIVSEDEGYEEAGRIVISSELNQQQTIRFLLPKIASCVMTESAGEEFSSESLEAESCAHVVAKHFGMCADYDFDYIADWSKGKSLEELTASLRVIQAASKTLIEGIEKSALARMKI